MKTFLSFREIDYNSKSFLSTKQDAVIKLINGETVIGVGKQSVCDVSTLISASSAGRALIHTTGGKSLEKSLIKHI